MISTRVLVFVLLSILCVCAEHISDLEASKDSFIFISGARCPPDTCTLRNTNYGKEPSVTVASKGDITAGLIAFSLESYKKTSPYAITKVELHLSADSKSVNVSDLGCSVSVMPLRNTEWSEASVNANNMSPADTTSAINVYIDNKGVHVPVTVTPWIVTALRNKQSELGLLISALGCKAELPSRETGNGAFLRVHTR
eukprot:Phypoly_transcript_15565.p1 GENE.Phypoly_transcript_15565~~Phypoly_transcript_15565.p1  ORF type:complete len:198 (+),score=15.77 Phypoly_transcript_15565:124-717(+)